MKNKNTPQNPDQGYVISYLTLRKAVGILGMALPFVLMAGFLIIKKGCPFPPSISHFYYTNMGNYFVGTLCAVSLFLFSYNGYDKADMITAKLAGLFALVVALSPTDFNSFSSIDCSRINPHDNSITNSLHYISATLLFSSFAFFSLILFTKTGQPENITKKKRQGTEFTKSADGSLSFVFYLWLRLHSFRF
ncbi:MAG: hypothetical protein JST96_13140 [Bacteroidetes bacterium]|nr:hypothetical protein [Bacteroidota bacterium]